MIQNISWWVGQSRAFLITYLETQQIWNIAILQYIDIRDIGNSTQSLLYTLNNISEMAWE